MRFLLIILALIIFSTTVRSNKIPVELTYGFWGDYVGYIKCNDIYYIEQRRLETNSSLGLATSFTIETSDSILNFQIKIVHIDKRDPKDYFFTFSIDTLKWIEFYVTTDKTNCERILKVKAHNTEYEPTRE
ncbi:MAG: hypothetical protein D6732_00500 [Methanobacteriota archaeon]|nr:MAG: hypothetical protein D6732_00500 [Euryarchaeota archaeon]